MALRQQSVKRQVMGAIMLTSLTVLILAGSAFLVYDLLTFRRAMVARLSITAAMLAQHSATPLAFSNQKAAQEILAALHADPAVVAAAIYDKQDQLYARYPETLARGALRPTPGAAGARLEGRYLEVVQPIIEAGARYGTLYLKSDLGSLTQRLRLYAGIGLLVLSGTFLVALVLSSSLQRRIMRPIQALAQTARRVSHQRDYSVRAPDSRSEELHSLTEAFNQMLARIQETEQIRAFSAAIVDSTDDAVVGKDLQGRVVSWNSGAERMFGHSAAEMVGQPILRLVSPDRPEEEQQVLERVCRGEVHHFETVRQRRDGRPISVSVTVSPIKNARGETIGISSICRDITERKQAEEQIRRLNAELEERVQERTAELTAANRELEAFTYSVAHDLRAPLRHVDAFTRVLGEDFGPELPAEAQQLLENIRKSSRSMSQLVDDLLKLARVGRQELQRRPTALSRLVEEAVAELKRDVPERNIQWRIHPLPVIECDPGLLKQVFSNLLSNAIKYTRRRPVATIEVGSVVVNGSATLFVRDNGVGFNMKYAGKLFGVFQRLHPAEEFEGTGVGLATVDRIVRKHGGRVWAEAKVDEGATFYFDLNRADAGSKR